MDPASMTLIPGGTATTSDTFTLQTDFGNDIIQSVVVSLASGTATGTSLIEITNNTGTIVYGSTSTTTSDTLTIPLITNTLTATSGITQYQIRITPKSHVSMPVPSVGISHALTSYISDWTGVNIINKQGSDIASTTITIDNRSPDNVDELGAAWRTRTSAVDNGWFSVTYGNGLFVAVSADGSSNHVMTSSGLTITATTTQVTITSYSPSITDLSTILVLRSTSSFSTSTTPVEGTSYATSSTIGAATAVCSVSITASTTHTCIATGLTNGTPYYFKIYTQDVAGNWSLGVEPVGSPISPGDKIVTLGSGGDLTGGTLAPGGSATTSDTFTFQTDTGSDVISSVTLSLAATTATSTSLIEITNNAGTLVYGSITNPYLILQLSHSLRILLLQQADQLNTVSV